MVAFAVQAGETFRFSQMVSGSVLYQFAGIAGDSFLKHVDEEFIKTTPCGGRSAHGLLTLVLSSTASSMDSPRALEQAGGYHAVSLVHDHVRFLKGVMLGDTVSIHDTVERLEPERPRWTARIGASNEQGDLVMVAQHISKRIKRTDAPKDES